MLGGSWLAISLLVLILSLVFHNVPLLFVSILFFLTGGASRLWNSYCLSRVEYRRELGSTRVFFGEEVRLKLEVANRKPLPLPWLEIEDELPDEVTLLKVKVAPSHKVKRAMLRTYLSMGWYHKVSRFYTLRCRQRGYFTFGPARVRSGDLFGFFRREAEVEGATHLMVYPKVVPLERLGIPSNQPLGNIRVKSHLFRDAILTAGVRNYQHGDALRQIHWKSSARSGELKTRLPETTTTLDMGVFLDVRTMPPPFWGVVPDLLELAIVTAASVANYGLEQGCRVGLYVNQHRRQSRELIRLAPSQHPDQLRNMLEALAQVHALESLPLARLVARESRLLAWGSTLLAISAAPTDALVAALHVMLRAGRRVGLIAVGDRPPPAGALPVYHIPSDRVAVLSDEDASLGAMRE